METIVGIGSAGCKIADQFSNYNNIYDIYKIDKNLNISDKSFCVQEQDSHEDYDRATINFDYFFRNVQTEVLVIVCGGGMISTITPKVLGCLVEKLGSKKVNVLYISPDLEETYGDYRLGHNVCYNVLMEWARSGRYNDLYLVDNVVLEKIAKDTPIYNYYSKMNELLVSTIHMINVFKHSEPVVASSFRKSLASKIATFSIYDVEKNEEMPFFSLDIILEKHYYYGINKETLETNGTLMQDIKNKMKEVNKNGQRGSYGVFETSYENNYGYIISYTQKVQSDLFKKILEES